MDAQPQPAPMVVAHALLCAATPATWGGGTPITAANVDQLYSSQETQEEAIAALGALGFGVRRDNDLALTIWGSSALFERAFRTRLAQQAPPTQQAPPPTTPPAHPPGPPTPGDTAYADHDPAPSPYWVALKPLVVPHSLRGLVEQVVLPTPATLFD